MDKRKKSTLADRMNSEGFSNEKINVLSREEIFKALDELGVIEEIKDEEGNTIEIRGKKKILYVDMDNVLADFRSALKKQPKEILEKYKGDEDEIPNLFSQMEPMKDAVVSFNALSKFYDIYILSTAPWKNPSAWSDKLEWVKKYLGDSAYKRLIISHHKNLNKGDFLIDDRDKNGAGEFEGELILFGSEKFKDWETVTLYLKQEEKCF